MRFLKVFPLPPPNPKLESHQSSFWQLCNCWFCMNFIDHWPLLEWQENAKVCLNWWEYQCDFHRTLHKKKRLQGPGMKILRGPTLTRYPIIYSNIIDHTDKLNVTDTKCHGSSNSERYSLIYHSLVSWTNTGESRHSPPPNQIDKPDSNASVNWEQHVNQSWHLYRWSSESLEVDAGKHRQLEQLLWFNILPSVNKYRRECLLIQFK